MLRFRPDDSVMMRYQWVGIPPGVPSNAVQGTTER